MSSALVLGLLAGAGGAALLLSVLLTPAAMRIAKRVGFVDRPGGHKSHRDPVPYGGGGAMFVAAWLPMAALLVCALLLPTDWFAELTGQAVVGDLAGGLRDRAPQTLVILLGGAVLFALGLVDDVRPLGPYLKLGVIVGVALLVSMIGGVRIDFADAPVAVGLTVAWLVVIINSFNFLDNMDGLSAGVAAICAAFLVVCGLMAEQVLVPALTCIFLGAILGFLVFNFPPARIFMGDAGSLLIGYMIGITSVLTTYWESGETRRPFAIAMPLVVLAVPLYDFASVVLIRLAEGRSPFRGDQRHFSHRLVERGLSRRFAVLTIYLATATTGLAATLLPDADVRQTVTVFAIVLMVLAIIAILEMPLRTEA